MRGPASLRSFVPRLLLLSLAVGCGGGGSDPVEPPPPPRPPPPTAAAVAASSGGTAQTATVATAVAAAPAVRVTSGAGQPMSGVAVAFAVTAGGGTLGAVSATTDAQGIASAGSWTLGTTAGANAARATVGSLTPVTFEATGQPGPVASLALVDGGGQEGWTEEVLPQPIVVKASDAHGNGVPEIAIAFATVAEQGAPSAARATTGANGAAHVTWTLGATEGTQTMVATAGGASASATATAAFPALKASAISVGWIARQCVVSTQGALSCWGLSDMGIGVLGDGTTEFRPAPVPIGAALEPFTAVSVGSSHSCALTATGTAYCWGQNFGRLGDGTVDPRGTPTRVAGDHEFVRIQAEGAATCALKADGTAWCWGNGGDALLHNTRLVPTPVGDSLRFVDITAGGHRLSDVDDQHCGMTKAGRTYCWAIRGRVGADGVQGPIVAYRPNNMEGAPPLFGITQGGTHVCALSDDGSAFCWGGNGRGQLGDGSTSPHAEPMPVRDAPRFAAISAGRFHTCALTAAGDAYCWGSNDSAQLGIGMRGDGAQPDGSILTPRKVAAPAGVTFTHISAGGGQTCAIATTSVVYCWGGLPRSGTPDPGATPVLVPTRVRAR